MKTDRGRGAGAGRQDLRATVPPLSLLCHRELGGPLCTVTGLYLHEKQAVTSSENFQVYLLKLPT